MVFSGFLWFWYILQLSQPYVWQSAWCEDKRFLKEQEPRGKFSGRKVQPEGQHPCQLLLTHYTTLEYQYSIRVHLKFDIAYLYISEVL